jgi:hypothetical protein
LLRLLIELFLLLALVPPALAVKQVEVPLDDSPSRGAAAAPVVMIEFIDFQ